LDWNKSPAFLNGLISALIQSLARTPFQRPLGMCLVLFPFQWEVHKGAEVSSSMAGTSAM
jgi:hypothetical protein